MVLRTPLARRAAVAFGSGRVAAVCLGLAVAGVARGAEIDLLPSLRVADVCPGRREPCWPASVSERLHRPDREAAVVLPPRWWTNLYLRTPAQAEFTLEVRGPSPELTIEAEPDGGAPVVVYRGGGVRADGEWRTVTADLHSFAGTIVRLGILVGPGGKSTDGVEVRTARLHADDEASPPAPLPSATRPPNVVIYLVDTLRADHLGCYGYGRPTTPRLDAFAASAVVFDDARAQSPWTLPSTGSLLTGLVPPRHGAVSRAHGIRPDVTTLADTLRRRGYHTAAFVTNYLGATFGQQRGFDEFRFYPEDEERRRSVFVSGDAAVRRVRRWLVHAKQPLLLYVHVADPHFPYVPPPRHLRAVLPPATPLPDIRRAVDAAWPVYMRFGGERPPPLGAAAVAELETLYDGDVHAVDAAFGHLLDALREHGLLEDAAVVVTADHGEEFLDHGGVAHGQTLYDELLRVPLIVHLPGGAAAGSRRTALAQHVDVMPTILELAGITPPPDLDGRSLLAPTRDDAEAFAFLHLAGRELQGISTAAWKVVDNRRNSGVPRFEVYRIAGDPHERMNVANGAPILIGYVRERLRSAALARPAPGPEVSPEQLERLKALGYVAD